MGMRAMWRAGGWFVSTGLLVLACGGPSESGPNRAAPAAATVGGQVASPTRHEAMTRAGRFRVAIRPEQGSAPLGQIHPWLVEVVLPDGEPAAVRQLVFDGGMPQHGHGFETSPRVTGELAPGVFRVDGIRFHMAGRWQIRVDVATPGVADIAVFEVEIGP